MNARGALMRAAGVLVVALVLVFLEGLLVRAAGHAEVSHRLLSAGAHAPPMRVVVFTLSVVGLRLFVRVLLPAIVFYALARIAAGAWSRSHREGEGGGSSSIGISDGAPPASPTGARGTK